MEEIEEIHLTLAKRIEEADVDDANLHARELRTSRAALKAIEQLLQEMKRSAA